MVRVARWVVRAVRCVCVWSCGDKAMWLSGSIVMLCVVYCGVVVWWCYHVVLWCGDVVMKCCDVMYW